MDLKSYISIKDLFPRLYLEFPGLIGGTYYTVTGPTGSGKTKFAKYLFVSYAYEYCKKHDIPLHVLYFALEESAEKFWITILCDLLYHKYGTTITYYQYMGFHEGLTPEIQKQMDDLQPLLEDMKKYIKVIDHVSNPTGIKKTIESFMATIGTKTTGVIEKDENGNEYSTFSYKLHNPETKVITVVDHIGLCSPEKNPYGDCSTLHAAITRLSEYAVKFFCKKYKIIYCHVHQQEMAGENLDNMKMDNLQPTISKLADNKIVGRDYMVIISIFPPYRYKTTKKSYEGYDISVLKDSFREVKIIKHRDGREAISSPMLFYGRINKYKELPKTDDVELEKVYKLFKK